MAVTVSAAFDGGNIAVTRAERADDIVLTIPRDHMSEFAQWFYFRLSGVCGEPCTIRLVGLEASAYPGGWPDYHAVVSYDRSDWRRADTAYDKTADGGTLTIRLTPEEDSVWIAYFAPYSMERHNDLVARIGRAPGVTSEVIGKTLDGQDMDLLTIGEGPVNLWFIARQHPGETMAEWWMEGALERLIDPADPVARALRAKATLRIVPNMNPDGSRRGHLRTNAVGVNLNREWASPSLERSPEVFSVLARMDRDKPDFVLDVHGDEAIPNNFIAGFEGIPSITDAMTQRLAAYIAILDRLSPDFQTVDGYETPAPGKANLTVATNALAERFGCLSMTLEMPFKDANVAPDADYGWSPARSKALGRDCLAATLEVLPQLR
jgi:murein tripeptide amidase MpaA